MVSIPHSSSCFLCKDEEVIDVLTHTEYDYYELGDKIFTSYIPEDSDVYAKVLELCKVQFDSEIFNPSDYIIVEGIKGIDAVYIHKDFITNEERNTLECGGNNEN